MHTVTLPEPLSTTAPLETAEPDLLWDAEHPFITEVTALEHRLLNIFQRGGHDGHETIFALDFTYITPQGLAYDREDTLQFITKLTAGLTDQTILDETSACQKDATHCTVRNPLRGQLLGDDFVLLTYSTNCGGGQISRSSLWRKTLRSWQIVFHQGTINQTMDAASLHS